jgi:hypothetical protein
MKTAVLCVAPYSLVEVYRRFRGACYLHLQGDVEARRLPLDTPNKMREIYWAEIGNSDVVKLITKQLLIRKRIAESLFECRKFPS